MAMPVKTSIALEEGKGGEGPVPREELVIGLIMTRDMYEDEVEARHDAIDDDGGIIGKAIKHAVDGEFEIGLFPSHL